MAIDIQTPINWQTVENAIYDWVTQVTGVNAQWADQADPQTDLPFCLLSISGPIELGTGDEKRVTEKRGSTGLPTDTYEIEHRGQREITVEVQVNTGPPDNENPLCYSRALVTRLQSSLNLEEFWRPLDAAGLGVIGYNPPINASLNVADMYIDRRVLEFRFTLASSVIGDIQIIEKATIDGELTRADGSVMDVGPIDVDATI
jgi:hypothetical protein